MTVLLNLTVQDRADFIGPVYFSIGPTFAGDFTITGAGKGPVLTTPDGLHTYRIAIDNGGVVTTEFIT